MDQGPLTFKNDFLVKPMKKVQPKQAGHWGFIEYRPQKKPEYRPNIDRKSYLKSAHLHYLLSPEIYTFWENEAFREI